MEYRSILGKDFLSCANDVFTEYFSALLFIIFLHYMKLFKNLQMPTTYVEALLAASSQLATKKSLGVGPRVVSSFTWLVNEGKRGENFGYANQKTLRIMQCKIKQRKSTTRIN